VLEARVANVRLKGKKAAAPTTAALRSPHSTARATEPARLPYQPALDGLRALAVIAVLVYHQSHLGGGFLGVDVFFVLSGFLITSLLLIDHQNTGRVISFGFWRRRARRLYPALLVLLAIAALYAATVAKPQNLEAIRNGSWATLLYVQNYWLIDHPRDFASPLNHTWSLSIEEQFYLVWPLVLAALIGLTRRTRWLVTAILALALASAAIMFYRYTTTHTTGSSYASTETRAQELLIGAALAAVLLRRRIAGSRYLDFAGLVAFAFLVVLVFTGSNQQGFLYRGGFLLVAVASAVLITAIVSENGLLRTALSWKPLVAIGLISYGLYLYHVPLFGFVEAQDVVRNEVGLVVMKIGLALIVATASYFLIERPIRHGALTRGRLLVVAPTAIAAVVAIVVVSTRGAAPPPVAELQGAIFRRARIEAPDSSTRVLMAGDTFASSFVTAEQPRFEGAGIQGVVEWASGGCDVLGNRIAIGDTVLPASPPCEFGPSYYSAVIGYQPDVVVLTFGPNLVFDRVVDDERYDVGTPEHREWLYERLDFLRGLLERGGAQLVLTTVPCMSPPTTGQYAGLAGPMRDPERIKAANAGLRAYAQDRNVRIADLGAFLCTNPEYMGDTGVHLSTAGVNATWSELAPIARDAHRERASR
jgi:peptidoglycan/LPS O-acetylase OafA/YrhL